MNMKRTAAVGGIFLLAVVLALSACVLMPVEAQDGGSGGGQNHTLMSKSVRNTSILPMEL